MLCHYYIRLYHFRNHYSFSFFPVALIDIHKFALADGVLIPAKIRFNEFKEALSNISRLVTDEILPEFQRCSESPVYYVEYVPTDSITNISVAKGKTYKTWHGKGYNKMLKSPVLQRILASEIESTGLKVLGFEDEHCEVMGLASSIRDENPPFVSA